MRRIVAGAVLTAVALGACGGGGGDEETVLVDVSPAGVARAAAQTLDDSSGRFTATVATEVLGQTLDFTFEGAFADGRSEMELDLADMLGQLPVDEALPAGFDEPIRMVLDGSTMYMCGAFLSLLSGGAECGSIDLGVSAGLGTGGANDPTAFLRGLAGTADVEEVGTEDVDGVETTHLRGSYTLRQALDALDAEQEAALRSQFEQLGQDLEGMLDVEVPFEVWIDGDGLVRRLTQTIDTTSLGVPEAAGTVDVDMRLFDLGDDITIDVPTDAVDLSELFGGQFEPNGDSLD